MQTITTIANTKLIINNTISKMGKPFKLSELYEKLAKQDIIDKALILDVLNRLFENGLVDYSSFEYDAFEYNCNFRKPYLFN